MTKKLVEYHVQERNPCRCEMCAHCMCVFEYEEELDILSERILKERDLSVSSFKGKLSSLLRTYIDDMKDNVFHYVCSHKPLPEGLWEGNEVDSVGWCDYFKENAS